METQKSTDGILASDTDLASDLIIENLTFEDVPQQAIQSSTAKQISQPPQGKYLLKFILSYHSILCV